MVDLSNVIALALGSDDVLQIQDAVGTVLWQKTIYYNVSISAGSNGTVSVNGVSGDYSQSVPSGTVLTIEGTGNTGYDFDEWSDGNTDNPRTITVTGDLTLTASFESAALPNYFYVEDISGSANTLSITNTSNDVYCSTDRVNWTLYNGTATIPANGKLYLKANINSWDGRNISASGNHNVGGNIMSLLYGDNFENQTSFPSRSNSNFAGLFVDNTHLISAVNLIFPATTLTDRCYNYMFGKCSSLTTAPTILPATTVTYSCYGGMFEDCSSLATAPVLPATTLADRCYENMFWRCASLTQAPVLPATTLISWCYRNLFNSCTNLNTISTYATDITADNCLIDWVGGVSATGTFYNMACTTYPSGNSGIPAGWTELHTLNDTINVTITNTGNYTGATYQIDSGTAQPINETGTTSFTVPVTATTLTIHRNGKGVTDVLGICGYSEDSDWDAAFPVGKMTDNVSIDIMSLM